ncbi:AMP-binding protein [Piscinibacter sakaiensis]|uniref:AMP-binding protein n=1 Tax=Piscinibacter sakaiensis TaxID=1547922 RepID=UPI003AACA0ED
MAEDTVYQAFVERAQRRPDADFLCTEAVTAGAYGIEAATLSYGDALASIESLRERYAAAGYGHGHRAGLLLENRPDFFLHWFALNALGVSVVPINNDLRSVELGYLLEHSELCLVVGLEQRFGDLRAAAAAGREPVLLRPDDSGPVAPPPLPAPRAGEPITNASECALLYTSGTTGRPKGCVLSNDYFLLAGQWYAGIGGLCTLRDGAERLITPLPLTHMNAMAYSAMAMVKTGGCLVQLDRFHPGSWWQSVRDTRATIVHYLGVMPAMLIGAPPSADDAAHRVRFGFGAGVDRRQHAAFEERFGFPLLEAWAMTETGAGAVVIANREPRHVGQSCFGRAEAAVEWRLVDEEGLDVPTGSNGELLVRAAGADPRRGFFSEYLKDEQATAEAWQGGWFHTGDLVRADADGNLFFVDRRKNVIRRSGENISAVEVESVLAQHPAVRAVGVAATPDAVRGDEVLACIVLREPVDADDALRKLAEDLTRHALQQLAYYKAPGYVAFVDALPLTLSQKVQRAQLKALAATLPGTPRCVDTRALKKRSS